MHFLRNIYVSKWKFYIHLWSLFRSLWCGNLFHEVIKIILKIFQIYFVYSTHEKNALVNFPCQNFSIENNCTLYLFITLLIFFSFFQVFFYQFCAFTSSTESLMWFLFFWFYGTIALWPFESPFWESTDLEFE